MTLLTLSNLADIDSLGVKNSIYTLAKSTECPPHLPLLSGTKAYAESWIVNWHSDPQKCRLTDVCCYSIADALVSGDGQIWIADHLITSPEVMPIYVARGLELEKGGSARLHRDRKLLVRTISEPCLVAIGHGTMVYGHFLIEMLFRLMVAQEALVKSGISYRVLLDRESPPWLLYILHHYFGVQLNQMEFFRPSVERVHLRHAIIPGRVLQDSGFHPYANILLRRLLASLPAAKLEYTSRRFFILRNKLVNPAAPSRICVNEPQLAAIAARAHGFVPITIENMEWRDQIAIFQDAEIILGQAGSGLHNALFSSSSSRLASIGFMNQIQSQISTLQLQRMAYLTQNVELKGKFSVDETVFGEFLERVCG